MGVMVQSLQAQQRSVHGKQAKDLVLQNINIFSSLGNKLALQCSCIFSVSQQVKLVLFSDFRLHYFWSCGPDLSSGLSSEDLLRLLCGQVRFVGLMGG